jgi:predicted dehydrogenase
VKTITTSRWRSRCDRCSPLASSANWYSASSLPSPYRLKTAADWRNDEAMAGGDAFFEEGIHWLHLAGSLGPRIVDVHGFRPSVSRQGPDTRAKSMMVAFRYDNDAVGTLYYSREIPSLFKGLRLSKLSGREGVITFESNGVFIVERGRRGPRLVLPGFRDIRGYQAMYRDFVGAIRERRAPEMSLERALEDQRLMDRIYETADRGRTCQACRARLTRFASPGLCREQPQPVRPRHHRQRGRRRNACLCAVVDPSQDPADRTG